MFIRKQNAQTKSQCSTRKENIFFVLTKNLQFFLLRFLNLLGRREYTLITKHCQVLDHQSDQHGINSNLSHFPDKEMSTSSHGSCDDELSIDDRKKPTETSPIIYTIYGFQYSNARNYVFHILSFLLLGIPYLLIKWSRFAYQLKHRPCDLVKCDLVYGK